MKRIYHSLIQHHLKEYPQMIFLTGPRQVGKTTLSLMEKDKGHNFFYFNWDEQQSRSLILSGQKALAEHIGLMELSEEKPLIIFDEIHKYGKWKNFLKGFFDLYKDKVKIIVTGSARLDIYKSGGDSLMGRYFPYRLHPLSVAELLRTELPATEISLPKKIDQELWKKFLDLGGFPEPLIRGNKQFYNRWQQVKKQLLFKEDIRDLSRIQELAQLELLAEFIIHQAAQLITYSSLAAKINVSIPTIRRWLKILSSFYYCFMITPWSKNISRSLIKEPKIYLWDWSVIEDQGARLENLVASHLLKAVHFWTDCGMGKYGLYFIRDKNKKEVDFVVTKNNKPWFLVEVKNSQNKSISEALYYFQKKVGAEHAFQVVFDREYINKDCFSIKEPVIVPAQTFLSQLI